MSCIRKNILMLNLHRFSLCEDKINSFFLLAFMHHVFMTKWHLTLSQLVHTHSFYIYCLYGTKQFNIQDFHYLRPNIANTCQVQWLFVKALWSSCCFSRHTTALDFFCWDEGTDLVSFSYRVYKN